MANIPYSISHVENDLFLVTFGRERTIYSVNAVAGKTPEIIPSLSNVGLRDALLFFVKERLGDCIELSGELPEPLPVDLIN